jgi:hypothetical protein
VYDVKIAAESSRPQQVGTAERQSQRNVGAIRVRLQRGESGVAERPL